MNLNELLARAYTKPSVNVTSDILEAAVAERAADARARAVQAVKGQLTDFETALTQNVQVLRNLRKQEKDQAVKVGKLDRALRYFGASGNPLPFYAALGLNRNAQTFCTICGIPFPPPDDPAWKVPDDFNAEVPQVD